MDKRGRNDRRGGYGGNRGNNRDRDRDRNDRDRDRNDRGGSEPRGSSRDPSQPNTPAGLGGGSTNTGGSMASPAARTPPTRTPTLAPVDTSSANSKPFGNDPSLVFPSTPYTPAVDAFMNPSIRGQFYNASVSQPLTNVTVAATKFSHFINIQSYDDKAKPSVLFPASQQQAQQVYRTTNRFNSRQVILRRLVDCQVPPADCAAIYERFRHFRHPNLVPLLNITQTQEFVLGSNDVIFEYRLIKGAKSFAEAFFCQDGCPCTEGVLWSIACQLVTLLRTFHEVKVALRGIHHSKMLYIPLAERVLFAGLGLADIQNPHPNVAFEQLAKGDIQAVGVLLLQLCSRNRGATERDLNELQQKPFSTSFVKLVRMMIEGNTTIQQLCSTLGERLAMEVGHQEGHADFFLTECNKEVHNGRLMKLMIKLNFVIGSYQDSNEWNTDTNERFALRMFQSFLFNQVDESHRPRVDWGHVYSSLNKLDCGSDELVHLISTDGNSTILVISYKDLKGVLDNAFDNLQAQADAVTGTPPTMSTPSMAMGMGGGAF